MAKRPTVEVDEEYLREVMAGGATFPKKTEPSVKEEKEVVIQPVETVEFKEPAKPVRKKKRRRITSRFSCKGKLAFPAGKPISVLISMRR
jgi:hypothetical protein